MKIPSLGTMGRVSCFGCDGKTLCVGTEDGCVIVWDVSDDREGLVVTATSSKIDKICVTNDRIVVTGSSLVKVFSSLPNCDLIFSKKLENMRILMSVSWHLDDRKMALAFPETGKIDIYSLLSGANERGAALRENWTLVKIAFLKYPKYFNCIFCLFRNASSEFGMTLFNIKSKCFLWRVKALYSFHPDFQLSTIPSPSGVILFGRQFKDDFLPYTWLMQKWSYDGQLNFSKVVHTEYMMHLGGVSTNSSADLNLPCIDHGPNILMCKLKTTKSILTVLISVWEKGMTVLDAMDPFKMVMAGTFLGSVCVTSETEEGGSLAIRDIESMEQLGAVTVPGRHDILWADSHNIVTINTDLAAMTPIQIITF